MKHRLLAAGLALLCAANLRADDVLWFGGLVTTPGRELNIPAELHDFSAQAGEVLDAPVTGIVSKKRKIIVGTEGTFQLDLDRGPTLAFDVRERAPASYVIDARFLLEDRVVFQADVRLARNQPFFILLPADAAPGVAGFFLLLR
jgi:hypothetical protein